MVPHLWSGNPGKEGVLHPVHRRVGQMGDGWLLLSKAEHMLCVPEWLVSTGCRWALRKCHYIETCGVSPACPQMAAQTSPAHSFPTTLLVLLVFHWVTVRGAAWVTVRDMSASMLPGVSEHSSKMGFIPADASSIPSMHFEGHKRRVLWGVKLQLVLCLKRTVFTDNYHIIVNTQERHDVKMKLLKTFLD